MASVPRVARATAARSWSVSVIAASKPPCTMAAAWTKLIAK